jgi:hypothetical protein
MRENLEFDSGQKELCNRIVADMSALGQKQTLTPVNLMSALPPKADID